MRMMLFLSAMLAFPGPVFGGLSYHFASTSTGMTASAVSGSVAAEGDRMRVDIERGDGALFPDHSYLISSGSHRLIDIVDPHLRTYSELSTEQLAGGRAILDQLRALIRFSAQNPVVTVRELGRATMQGYPAKHQLVTSSFDVVLEGPGRKARIGFVLTSEVWTTDALPVEFTNVLDLGAFQSGIPEIDKVLAERTAALRGFPLKQISTTTIDQEGSIVELQTVTVVTNIEKKTFAPALFALPPDYEKTENPIERAVRGLAAIP